MPKRTDMSSIMVLGAVVGLSSSLGACGKAPLGPRRQESFAELYQRQNADLAASPDVQLPDVRKRLRALGVADEDVTPATDTYGEPMVRVSLDDAQFARIDKAALAKLWLDSRFRFELDDPPHDPEFAQYVGVEMHARENAKALRELAEKGETDRIPRYRTGMLMVVYARSLEAYCGYGPGRALRVIDGEWLEYTHKMTSDAAIAASKRQSYAPFACMKRVVDATDLGRHFIGNRGREGAIDY